MIPIAIAIGFVLGLISKAKWWTTSIAGVIWAVVLLNSDVAPDLWPLPVGAFALGMLNGLAGWGVARFATWTLRRLFTVFHRKRHPAGSSA